MSRNCDCLERLLKVATTSRDRQLAQQSTDPVIRYWGQHTHNALCALVTAVAIAGDRDMYPTVDSLPNAEKAAP